tara:strand:+ start:250 stop:1203 length:954 start_codon:yes stop_codon:yes gene_type:complete
MATNWPTHIWNPQDPLADDRGMVPFQVMDPGTAVLQSRGLTHDVYREHRGSISDSSIRAWDVMENPFYQAMAEYEGYDWNTLVAQFNEEIGPIENQPHRIPLRSSGPTQGAVAAATGGVWTGTQSSIIPGTDQQFQTFDTYAEAVAWAEENNYDISDIELAAQPQRSGRGGPFSGAVGAGVGMGGIIGMLALGEDGEEERFWGITDEKWIERFNEWTSAGEDLIKKFQRQDAPIIRRGPSAADYGIIRADNNIYAHYGLDRPPADPKELATNYKWNLAKTWTSDVSYAVPPDLKRVNLSGDWRTHQSPVSNPILAST